jgi:hypothetical protein
MDEVTGRQERGSFSSREGKEKDLLHDQYNELLLGVWVNEQRRRMKDEETGSN